MANTLSSSVAMQNERLSVVRLGGRLDITSAGTIKNLIAETVRSGACQIVVDLTDVSFIDSSGLSALVSGLRLTRQAGGDLRIAEAPVQAAAVFALTSLDQIFRLYPTVGEALHAFED